jgi:hypothetical protein
MLRYEREFGCNAHFLVELGYPLANLDLNFVINAQISCRPAGCCSVRSAAPGWCCCGFVVHVHRIQRIVSAALEIHDFVQSVPLGRGVRSLAGHGDSGTAWISDTELNFVNARRLLADGCGDRCRDIEKECATRREELTLILIRMWRQTLIERFLSGAPATSCGAASRFCSFHLRPPDNGLTRTTSAYC